MISGHRRAAGGKRRTQSGLQDSVTRLVVRQKSGLWFGVTRSHDFFALILIPPVALPNAIVAEKADADTKAPAPRSASERRNGMPPSDELIRAVAKGEIGIEALDAATVLQAEPDDDEPVAEGVPAVEDTAR